MLNIYFYNLVIDMIISDKIKPTTTKFCMACLNRIVHHLNVDNKVLDLESRCSK